MGEVVSLESRLGHICVEVDGTPCMLPVSLVRSIMSGRVSIAECDDPEHTARILAAVAMILMTELT